ncbi:hypothetical protein H0H87_010171 [Tephrocybe sp. NHM501043]|nr:hypothetical protein H0H87_010171 [Tephrocybe sp. NHM501043]
MRYHAFLLLLPASLAFQLPFNIPFFTRNDTLVKAEQQTEGNDVPRIAIIGAGAGGSSAAFWISKAKERFNLSVEVDVYEKASYIGGRSITVHPYHNTSLPPLELGASIFVSANKNLWRASDEFNLTRRLFAQGGRTSIWDGEEILFTFGDGWWDTLKAILRFGVTGPKRMQQIVKTAVEKYLTVYSSEAPNWNNIFDLSAALGYSDMVNHTASSFFLKSGVSRRFAFELVEGATRVNYGQNLDTIHGLGGTLSMATDDARGIEGGNFQIFEQFLKRSGANVHLNTLVSVNFIEKGTGAAPFHSTGIALPVSLANSIPEQPYVHLHVTLLTTTSPTPNPAYFGVSVSSALSEMTLTTYEGVRNGKKEPQFNSLSYHGLVREGEWAVKIFSKEKMSDEVLNELFQGKVGWVYRKRWDAYPELKPTTTFPPVKVDHAFFYVNALEPLISTMETETVASRNVVDLLLNEQFGTGICGPLTSSQDSTGNVTRVEAEGFVLGWDC